MERQQQILQIIQDAISEVNETLDREQVLETSPDTVLIGGSGKLDSLGFLNLTIAVVEHVERAFNESIELTDIFAAADQDSFTVAALAGRVAELVDHAAPG